MSKEKHWKFIFRDMWETQFGMGTLLEWRYKVEYFINDIIKNETDEKLKEFVSKLRGDLIDFNGDYDKLQDIVSDRLIKEISK